MGNLMYMSEHEKFEQVGRLAEEYSHLKGQLNHVTEKVTRTQHAYTYIGQNFQSLQLVNDKLVMTNQGYGSPASPDVLLGHHELLEAFRERARLTEEVNEVAGRLKALAPHLLP
jgi:hypothetical protein